MANAECRIIREDRIRKQETLRAIEDSVSRTLPSADGLMDLRVEQRERANELAAQGFFLVAQGVDHLEFANLARSRELPPRSVHLWAIDEAWSPIAVRVNRRRIHTRLNVQPEPISPERADELARMLALPDASEVTAEQMAYRRKVQSEIEAAEPAQEERAALTPRTELMKRAGNFCVSFADARDADWCLMHGQSVMWNNGRFTAFTQGNRLTISSSMRG